MIAAHATQWPNTEKSIMEFHYKKKERRRYKYSKCLSKVKLSIRFIEEEFNCVLSFCHCEKHFEWSQEGVSATNH